MYEHLTGGSSLGTGRVSLHSFSMQSHEHSILSKAQSQFYLMHSNEDLSLFQTQLQFFSLSWKMFGVFSSLHYCGVMVGTGQLFGVLFDGVMDGTGSSVAAGSVVVGTAGMHSVVVGGNVGISFEVVGAAVVTAHS